MDKSTGKKQDIIIQSSGGLSDAEIERMVNDAESKREEDEIKKKGVGLKNDAENLIYSVEKQINDLKESITEGDRKDLNEKIGKLREILSKEGDSLRNEDLENAHKELQDASWKVSQDAYQKNANAGEGDQS